jgi:tRNA(fMet)-specific endonuclease VapC
MKYLLDTNTCIRFLNGRSESIKRKMKVTEPEDIVLCSVVKAELFYGSLKSRHPEKNLQKQYLFVNRFKSLPFDDDSAEKYGEIRANLEKTGMIIGPNDLLIASITLTHNVILVTNNLKEFSRIEGLKIEDWERAYPVRTDSFD